MPGLFAVHYPKKQQEDDCVAMARDCDINCTARTLKAISHPLRLKILCALDENELSVMEIVENSGSSQSNVSQHLNYLRSKGVLCSRRQANRVFYRITRTELIDIIKMMNDLYCKSAKQ